MEDYSVSEITFCARLYELKSREIKIDNIFDSNVNLTVNLSHKTPESNDETFLPPFSTKVTKLVIAKGGSAVMPVQFLPFSMKTQICQVVFSDEKCGDFHYTLKGEVDLPVPIELESPQVFYLESDITLTSKLSVQNPLLQNARKVHAERVSATQRSVEEEKLKVLKNKEKGLECMTFDVESLKEDVFFKRNFTGKDEPFKLTEEMLLPENIKSKDETFNLLIRLNFNTPVKDFPFRLLLKSQDGSDIRVYEVKVTVMPKPIREVIEIRCPAKSVITKDLPFNNESDKDWMIKAQLIPDSNKNGSCFSGPKEIRIPKKTTTYYQILFKPHEVLQAEAKLLLSNSYTGQQYEYELKGYGEESTEKSE